MKKDEKIPPTDSAEATKTKAQLVRETEIADRLRETRDRLKIRNRQIAEALGIGEGAVKKIMGGNAVAQFAKLALLCEVLQTTPNEILGFSVGSDRAKLQGILEALLIAHGSLPLDAEMTAQAVLQALEQPLTGIPGIDVRDIARIQTESVVRQALRARSAIKRDA